MKKFVLLITFHLSLFTICKAQYSVLFNFNGTNGQAPYGGLVLSGKTLFGTTSGGGINNGGCVFSIDTDGTHYKKLYDFSFIAAPSPTLVLSGEVLYGMTSSEGAYGKGYIFSIDTDGSQYRDLFDFDADTAGVGPLGSLVLVGNKLYGMAQGGLNSLGCIFSIDTDGNNYKKLLDFNYSNGRDFYDGNDLIFYRDKLYGMTPQGGADSDGCIFSIDTNGNGYKKLLDFNGANGKTPDGDLILLGDKLYGMTALGGLNNVGCVFSIDTIGSGYEKLLDFNITNGANPYSSFVILGNKLYAMTGWGGLSDSGVIFSIDTNGNGYKKLLNFNGPNGKNPGGALTADGNVLYGTSVMGGMNNDGVIFKIDTSSVAYVNDLMTSKGEIKVYPNPNNGVFTIAIRYSEASSASQTNIEIYNMLGEKIYTIPLPQTPKGALNEINISNEPNGVYLYRVIDENSNLIGEGKVVVQK